MQYLKICFIKNHLIFFPLILLILFNCQDNNANQDNHDQEDVVWQSLADSPWPMHMHDPQHTGRSPYAGPSEGEVVWSVALPLMEIFANPVIDEIGNIIVAGEHPYGLVKVYSFTQEGVLNWEYSCEGCYEGSSALATSDSLIYINLGHYLTQMDVNGNVNWQFEFNRQILHSSRLTPNISPEGNYLYVSGYDSALYSINRDGTLNWKYSVAPYESFGEATLSPDGETIYFISEAGILYAINEDGTEKWQVQLLQSTPISPVVDQQGNIYLYALNTLYCITPEGSIAWENNELSGNGLGYDGCTIGPDGTINVSTSWGYYAFNPDGTTLWRKDLLDAGVVIANLPVVDVDGNVYLGKEHIGNSELTLTNFISYDVNGDPRFIVDLAGRVNIGSPACIDNSGHVIIGSDNYLPQLIKIK